MSNINTQPIIDLIRAEAKESARKIMQEAQDRATTIKERSSERLEQMLEKTRLDAQSEGDLLQDRMLRMASLEQRKSLVSRKRELIDDAFTKAIEQLNNLPSEQVAKRMKDMLLAYAKGDETLAVGAVNDSFFTQQFLKDVNDSLKTQNKPGTLTADNDRVPGVCGLILKDNKSEIYCTFEALLETRREELESVVADILFPAEQA